jgi:hypothetical protein
MAIQFLDGQILFDGGQVATDSDCCCGECVCSVPITYGVCDCATADYGPKISVGDAEVTLTGTPGAKTVDANPPFGPTCTPAAPSSLAGTYIVACNTSKVWCKTDYACTVGGFDWYYFQSLLIEWTSATFLRVTLNSNVTKTNLYPTLTTPCTGIAFWKQRQLSVSLSDTVTGWEYEPSASCRAECNFPIARLKCPNGRSAIWTTEITNTPIYSAVNYVEIDDYVVTAVISS